VTTFSGERVGMNKSVVGFGVNIENLVGIEVGTVSPSQDTEIKFDSSTEKQFTSLLKV
jgi:hypothetical protein